MAIRSAGLWRQNDRQHMIRIKNLLGKRLRLRVGEDVESDNRTAPHRLRRYSSGYFYRVALFDPH